MATHSSRDGTQETCAELTAGLKARRLALHPAEDRRDRRKLPEGAPSVADFRRMLELVEVARSGLSAMHDAVEPRHRPTRSVRLTPRMARFLALPSSFEGRYKREMLVRAVGAYATVHGLHTVTGMRLDRRLAKATGKKEGDAVTRQGVFALVASTIVAEPKKGTQGDAGEPGAAHESDKASVEAALEEERRDLEAFANVLAARRDMRDQVKAIDASPDVALFEVERARWLERAAVLDEEVKELAGRSRFLMAKASHE
jgi:hypothetical protein